MEILGVKISEVTLEQARLKVLDFLVSPGQYKIFTPNPEMLVKAQKDKYFKDVLNSGDLNICDGMGLWFASQLSLRGAQRRSNPTRIHRIPGADFILQTCQIAEQEGKSIFLLGSGNDGVVQKTAQELQIKFPKILIAGYDKGSHIEEKLDTKYKILDTSASLAIDNAQELSLLAKINVAAPDILFVAFGMGKQEKWIHENLAKLPSVKLAMGVGGAFDYLSGKVKRAPCWMRKIGLEWVYRLLNQPKRFWRVFNATFHFIYLVIRDYAKI